MKLEELKKKLYRPESEFEERIARPKIFQPEQKREQLKAEDWLEKERKRMPAGQKRILLWGGLTVAIVFLGLAGWLIWRGMTSFDKDQVKLEITGPERIVSGEEIKYLVKYQNNTRLTLKDIQMVFHFSDNAIPLNKPDLIQTFNLPGLAVGQANQLEMSVRIIGLKGEKKEIWAELSYQPGEISSRFTNRADFASTIISVPLIVDFDLPEKIVSGQSFNFSLKYLNQAETSFDNIRVKIDYPLGFSFQSAEPDPLENDNVWSLGNLMAGEQGKIFIRGVLQGNEGESKSFKAQLGVFQDEKFNPYTETASAILISLSPLAVSQTVNGTTDYVVKAGQTLDYQINYKNTTEVGIKDVVITAKLSGSALDLAEMELGQGSFDGENQTITWKTSNLPVLGFLGPHQQGEIEFSVKVKDPLPVKNYSDKNFIITDTVKIDSMDVPLSLEDVRLTGESVLITKVASDLTFRSQGYFYDDLFGNSGPIPPRVGQTTTYTIKWRLVNTSNDLSQVKVSAFLPPHVHWLDKINPADSDLKYNFQTGQVTWTVGDLPAGTSVLLPVKQVAFQISITPGLAHLGNLVELIGQAKASGYDDFVNLDLSSTASAIDTDLPDDPAIGNKEGTVVE